MSIVDFFKNKLEASRSKPAPPARKSERSVPQPTLTTVRIDFEMMLKGSVYDRPTGRVRQFGVTVNGSTKVVTSGDFVDRATYEALLRAGAIRPRSETPPPEAPAPHHRHHRKAS